MLLSEKPIAYMKRNVGTIDVGIASVAMSVVRQSRMNNKIVSETKTAARSIWSFTARIELRTRVARKITIAKRLCKLALDLHIIDNGPGIPEDIRDRIFYPLVSGRDDGSGLGLTLAQIEFDRAAKLVADRTVSQELYDQRQATLSAARADVAQALADVHQIRVSLGLPPQPESGNLAEVPANLDQTFSSVLEAQAALIQAAARLGVAHSYAQLPKQMVEQFEKRDQGDIDRALAALTADAPAVKQAQAKLESANRDLIQAELDLRYCDVVAEIDGAVTRRSVNPGDNVQAGQSLMAIRSLTEIWVDANFKETQLRDLRIGQQVDLYVDMYGDRHVFKGRVSGFTMGTGSTLSLLPPENATGNFIKVVQRLPVRIDLEGYDPNENPLFIGTSVVPYVYLNKPLTGPDAGKFLQTITNR